ncbi:MAG: hypothetical protein KBA91_03100 [Candidatus Moranbacteria bacterium]|jgi:hypothetical protein|nr:hypothetical protein [Candidatus Moranbacteria bacterium]
MHPSDYLTRTFVVIGTIMIGGCVFAFGVIAGAFYVAAMEPDFTKLTPLMLLKEKLLTIATFILSFALIGYRVLRRHPYARSDAAPFLFLFFIPLHVPGPSFNIVELAVCWVVMYRVLQLRERSS